MLKYWPENSAFTVLTVKPSYFYAYDKELSREIPPFVRVVRTGSLDPFRLIYLFKKIIPARQKKMSTNNRESAGLFRKISAYLFLPDSRVLWLPFALLKLWRIHRERQIDLLIATAPPFTSALIGKIFSGLSGVPLLLDMRDAWTNNPYLPEVSKIYNKIQTKLEAAVFKTAAATVFVNPHLQSYYLSKYPYLKERPGCVVRNGYDAEDFKSLETTHTKNDSRLFTIGIMGTIYSQGNAPYPLLKAVKLLREKEPHLAGKLKIVFIGKWADDFLSRIREMGVEENCQFVAYRPHREALQLAKKMDMLSLAVEDRGPGSENVTPGRIYEYLALRRPILAMGPAESDIKYLLEESGSGYYFEYGQTDIIFEHLLVWLNNPLELSCGGDQAFLSNYERKNLAAQYYSFLSSFFLS
ncbi:MAG: hypothetical protein Kow0037_18440 [Calditrichia bacterium]